MVWTREGATWNPWRELERLQADMNRVFPKAFLEESYAADFPAVNVWTSDDRVVVTAELPGVDSKELDVSVVGDTLTIRGLRKAEALKQGESLHRQERGYGQFSRSIRLPFEVEGDGVDASVKNGVLQVALPRAEADRPKRVTVKAA